MKAISNLLSFIRTRKYFGPNYQLVLARKYSITGEHDDMLNLGSMRFLVHFRSQSHSALFVTTEVTTKRNKRLWGRETFEKTRIFALLHVLRAFVCSIELKIKKKCALKTCAALGIHFSRFKFINLLSLRELCRSYSVSSISCEIILIG